METSPAPRKRAIWRRALMLAVTLVTLYVVSPNLLSMLSAWPELLTIHPAWSS